MRTVIALLLAASSLTAGVSYDFKSVTAGKNGATLAGAAAVEGKSTRIDFTSGDNLLFKSNTTLLSNDGGKTYLLIDPAEKSYYQFSFDQLLKSAGNMLKAMGGLVQMSVTNQKVNVKDAGVGEPIEGYPTRKQIVTSTYDMSMKIMGMNTKSSVQSTAETWYTDKIPSDSMTFIQQKGLRTGFDDLDKLIEAQSKGVKGFPLKQVMTMKSTSGKQSDTTVTTTTISNIQKRQIPASRFAVPAGFVKKESPTLAIPGMPPRN